MVSITSSAGMANVIPASAISIAASAIAAPVALRKTHGSSTRPPSGSHTSPSVPCCASATAFDDLLRRAAQHLGAGAGRHSRRGAGLRLTAAFRAGQRRALGDHRADEPRGRQRVDDARRTDCLRRGESGEHRRQHARAARRRRRDDHAHRGVHLLHGERARQDVAKRRVRRADPPGRATSLAASPPTSPDADLRSPTRPCSTAPCITCSARAQRIANLGDRTALVLGLGLERELRQRDPRGFGVADGFGERAIHRL